MRACALGNSTNSFNIVKLLLSSRSFDGLFQTRLTLTSKFEERSLFGDGCLHWAATGGSLEIFTYLCSLGCNPFDLDNDLSSPLHWAAGSGSSAILNYLITTLEDDVNKVNVFGCTPAHFASSGGQLTILKFLLVHGCDLLKQNYHGHDALTKAVAFNRNNIVDWLVKEVPGVKETINKLRPWNIDTKSNNTINMSLFQIAAIVGNHEKVLAKEVFEPNEISPAERHEPVVDRVEPKVYSPIKSKPGHLPRRIKVERTKRNYASFDLTNALIKNATINNLLFIRKNKKSQSIDQFPLSWFDNLDYEPQSAEYWANIINKTEGGLPARALYTYTIVNKDNTEKDVIEWRLCDVIDAKKGFISVLWPKILKIIVQE
eukprot:gene18878-24670_t